MHHTAKKIAVINPNSNPTYTEIISKSLDSIRLTRDVEIECLTLEDAPLAIESDDDIAAVVKPICNEIEAFSSSVTGVVIACFADPGLLEAKKIAVHSVIGSCEASVLASISVGPRLGLISTGDDIEADRELIFSYSQEIEYLAVEDLGIPTADIPTAAGALSRMIECGQNLQAQKVDAVMLGCAGMSAYSQELASALDVPVVDSVTTAVNLLLDEIEHAENQSTASA